MVDFLFKGDTSRPKRVPLRALARVASVAAGVQFGWALQLSLLTPYVQELGIPHTWASYIWLCGPVTGMIVQPLIGYHSDHCQSPWGRRRPFIVVGAFLVVIAVALIGFAADLGYLFGDSLAATRPRAIVVFVLGFWILDLANNTLQGPCRALLADFTGKNQRRTRRANAFFSLFMAVGNVLGFAAGSVGGWYKIFPFTKSKACDVSCANLKSAFFIDIVILIITVIFSVTAAPEIPWRPTGSQHIDTTRLLIPDEPLSGPRSDVECKDANKGNDDDDNDDLLVEEVQEAFLWELLSAFRDLPRPMWYILIATALTWIAWFPFMLFDTDWMGRDVYGGEPSTGTINEATLLYNKGVGMGAFGLMLQSVVLGLSSLAIEFLCRKIGPSYLWAFANLILTVCFASCAVITSAAQHERPDPPSTGVVAVALVLFAVLGAPLAVTYSVPYALTATFTSSTGGGQGLSMGVLNLAVVVPQVIISLGSGPFDTLFGGGNVPAFLLGSASALLGAIFAVFLLPRPPPEFISGGIRRTRSSPIP